jgi:hypothetical protein
MARTSPVRESFLQCSEALLQCSIPRKTPPLPYELRRFFRTLDSTPDSAPARPATFDLREKRPAQSERKKRSIRAGLPRGSRFK